MTNFVIRLCGVVALFSVSLAVAQTQNCYEWRYSTSGPWMKSELAAAAAYVAGCPTGPATGAAGPTGCDYAGNVPGYSFSAPSAPVQTSGTWPGPLNYSVTATRTNDTTGATNTATASFVVNFRIDPTSCSRCPETGAQRFILPSQNAQIPAGSGQVCLDECLYQYSPGTLRIGAGAGQLASIRSEGRSCASTPGAPPEDDEAEDDDCMQVPGIGLVCAESDRCGSVNGDVVCPGEVPDGGCVGYRSGGVACDSDAASPPAPDDGTPGSPAPPDVTIEVNNNQTNYFNSGTSGGSSEPPVTSPPQGGGAIGGGSSSCTGDDCGSGGDGTASGGETCVAPPVCEGDAISCAILDQQWRNRCVEMPTETELESAFGPTGDESGNLIPTVGTFEVPSVFDDAGWIGASCPSDITINLGGQLPTVTVPISYWCDWLSIIGVMIMVSAYIGGVRIVVGGL